MKPLLLNIRLIEMIEASNLAGQIEISGGRCVLPTGLEPITIPTVGLADARRRRGSKTKRLSMLSA